MAIASQRPASIGEELRGGGSTPKEGQTIRGLYRIADYESVLRNGH